MTDETNRAERAANLLRDDLLIEVLDSIEQAAIDAWAGTPANAQDDRETAYHSLKASRRVRETLKGIVDNGLVAASRAVRR